VEKEKTGPVREGETVGVKDQVLFLFVRALNISLSSVWKTSQNNWFSSFLCTAFINIQ